MKKGCNIRNEMNTQKITKWILLVVGAIFVNSYAHAAALNVPGQYSSIQVAIDAASNGDTVLVSDGTYTGSGNRDIDFKGKAITVRSINGPGATIIDCQGTSTDPHRGFFFHSNETANSVLDGFTIKNGYGPDEDLTDPPQNVKWSSGGGIYCTGSSPSIINNIISENTAKYGAGIQCWKNSSPTIRNNIIRNNAASAEGGGIFLYNNCSSTLDRNIISDNSAQWGGGVAIHMFSPVVLTNNLIVRNSGSYQGGGLHCGNSQPSITNNTIAQNASASGGGAYFWYATPTITNCILWGDTGGEIFNDGGHSSITVSYSDIGGGYPGTGNLNADPLFAGPSDFHLIAGSPCIDTGNNSAPGIGAVDLDGNPRIFNGIVDIGAYEKSPLIDRNKWADLEFAREIIGETVDKKLLSEIRAPNTGDATGSGYRWANNSLYFPEPEEVTSIQAEVSVLRIIHTNPNTDTRAMLTGRWYNDGTPGGGDIWAAVFLGATSLPGGAVGLVARWEVTKLTNLDGTTWVPIAGGSGIFDTPVTFGRSYTLYIKYDSGSNQFTFKIGNETKTFGTGDGLPPWVRNANNPFKGLRTRVWLRGPTESGIITATFDNVKKNEVDYDNFNDSADMGMINKDRWNPWELVRRSNEGLIESALTRYFSNGSNNMSFVDSQQILGFEADLKVLDILNQGARPQGRLYAALYNDGTSSGPGDVTGDVHGIVGILDNGLGSGPQAFYAVSRCLAPACNLSEEYEVLTSGIFKDVALGDPPHRFSLSWNGLNITFGCDGDIISYNPTSVRPILSGDGHPKSRKGIGTRVTEIRPNTSDWAYVSAAFDNVVITAVDSDLDGLDDAWEMANFGDLNHGASEDFDGDGLTNLQEYQLGTNPRNTDTDGDGMPDAWEVANGLNPLVNDAGLDPDRDGLTNLREYQLGFNPNIADTRTISASSGANGSIIPSGVIAVNYGSNQTFTINPAFGYHVADVLVDGISVGAVTSYPFTNVTANHTISASFVIDTFTISGTVTYKGTGLAGVTMDGFPGTPPPVTNVNGNYSGTVPYGWSGTVTPGKTGYTFIPDSTTYTNVTENWTQNYDALSAATTTKRDEEIGGLKVCSEFTDVSGYPTKMYNCLDPSSSACNCPPASKEDWGPLKPFSDIQAGLDHITWIGPGPDPLSVDIITGSSTCIRRCYPSGYCYVGPPGCNPGTSGADAPISQTASLMGATFQQTPPPPPVITFRQEKIGDVEICSEPEPGNTSGCPTLVYSCGDTGKTPWPTKEFSQITVGKGHITWVGIGSDPICPTVNIITASSTCVRRCYPSGYCYVGPTGCNL